MVELVFFDSLAEPTAPSPAKIPSDSNVEMTWKVFGGTHHDIYMALLKERCHKDGLEITEEVIAEQFKLHLHRGVGYLFADKSISSVLGLVSYGSR